MAEPVATRVDPEAKQWLESRAEERDETVSDIVAELIEEQYQQRPETNETAPVESRLHRLERVVSSLSDHNRTLQRHQEKMAEIRRDVSVPAGGLEYPELVAFPDPGTEQN